jgi:hypothetical protein
LIYLGPVEINKLYATITAINSGLPDFRLLNNDLASKYIIGIPNTIPNWARILIYPQCMEASPVSKKPLPTMGESRNILTPFSQFSKRPERPPEIPRWASSSINTCEIIDHMVLPNNRLIKKAPMIKIETIPSLSMFPHLTAFHIRIEK